MSRQLIEIMIPTLNEASHISETVANALQVGPVFVLDSQSTDGTQERGEKSSEHGSLPVGTSRGYGKPPRPRHRHSAGCRRDTGALATS